MNCTSTNGIYPPSKNTFLNRRIIARPCSSGNAGIHRSPGGGGRSARARERPCAGLCAPENERFFYARAHAYGRAPRAGACADAIDGTPRGGSPVHRNRAVLSFIHKSTASIYSCDEQIAIVVSENARAPASLCARVHVPARARAGRVVSLNNEEQSEENEIKVSTDRCSRSVDRTRSSRRQHVDTRF